jgi:hypothetical protein
MTQRTQLNMIYQIDKSIEKVKHHLLYVDQMLNELKKELLAEGLTGRRKDKESDNN